MSTDLTIEHDAVQTPQSTGGVTLMNRYVGTETE